MDNQIKVLCFTASSRRPIYLRHCILQMQAQSHNLDHVVYLNSPDFESFDDEHNYVDLFRDISIAKGNKLFVGYGPSSTHHRNHMAAIDQVDWNDYDLFFKIDDDDIYKQHYIKDAVHDYNTRKWDFSGEISKGHIRFDCYKKNNSLSEYISDIDFSEKAFMPPTFAWNKKSMKIIASIEDIKGSEDYEWRKILALNKKLKTLVRKPGNFIYNIHKDSIHYR